MSRFKIINVFDKIFVSACVFLLIYAWLNFFARNLWFSFIVSLILSAAILFVLFYLIEKNKVKKAMSKQKIQDIENTFLCFKTMRKDEKLQLLKNLVCPNSKVEIFNNSMLVNDEKETQQIFIETNEQILSEQALFSVLERRSKDAKKIIIICENFNPKLNVNLLKNLTIEIVDKTNFYNKYILPSNIKLDLSTLNTKTRKNIRQLLSNLFIPVKAKQYFFCGLILIFSSLILPYKTYYLIFGSLFLVFTILCKLQPVISNRINGKN